MNKCLLTKWIFKIECGEDNLCCTRLRQKYLGEKGFFRYKKSGCSQFWKSLLDVRNDRARSFKYIIGDGKKVRFWHDTWLGDCPLKISFPHLYFICNQQDVSVYRVFNQGNLRLTFRRNFGCREDQELAELTELVGGVSFSENKDIVKWVLEKSGRFTTSSMYKDLTFTGFFDRWMQCLWQTKIPLKIKIFLWQVINDKIQSAEQLKKRNRTGPIECGLCGQAETTNHIFFHCALASFCWCVIRDVLGWPFSPSCHDDIWSFCRDCPKKGCSFCSVAWLGAFG
jgi:hypothetical protein